MVTGWPVPPEAHKTNRARDSAPSAAERGPASEPRERSVYPQHALQSVVSPPQHPTMADTELATVDIPAAAIVKRRIPRKIGQVVDLLVTGECATQKAACERVGMHQSYVSRALREPHIQVFIARRARETIANGTMRASARLLELLEASSEHVSLDATKHVLGIAGIKPSPDTQVSVNIELKAGYVIDLRDDAPPPMLDLKANEP